MTTTDSVFQRAVSNMLTEIFDGPGEEAFVLNPAIPAWCGSSTGWTRGLPPRRAPAGPGGYGCADGLTLATVYNGPMRFNPGALVILVGFFALVAMAGVSNGGTWFHAGEAVSTALIAIGLAGFLSRGWIRQR